MREEATADAVIQGTILERNPKAGNKRQVSHRAAAVLRAVKVKCQISDSVMLLLQYLMFEYFFGFLPSTAMACTIFMTGANLTTRLRQLDWFDRARLGEKLRAAPGLWYVTSDATNVKPHGEMHSKHVHFWDVETKRPEQLLLSVASLPGKTASAAAADDVKRLREQPGLIESRFGGGNSDNASNAALEIQLYLPVFG